MERAASAETTIETLTAQLATSEHALSVAEDECNERPCAEDVKLQFAEVRAHARAALLDQVLAIVDAEMSMYQPSKPTAGSLSLARESIAALRAQPTEGAQL